MSCNQCEACLLLAGGLDERISVNKDKCNKRATCRAVQAAEGGRVAVLLDAHQRHFRQARPPWRLRCSLGREVGCAPEPLPFPILKKLQWVLAVAPCNPIHLGRLYLSVYSHTLVVTSCPLSERTAGNGTGGRAHCCLMRHLNIKKYSAQHRNCLCHFPCACHRLKSHPDHLNFCW